MRKLYYTVGGSAETAKCYIYAFDALYKYIQICNSDGICTEHYEYAVHTIIKRFHLPLGIYQVFQYLFLFSFIIMLTLILEIFDYKTIFDQIDIF